MSEYNPPIITPFKNGLVLVSLANDVLNTSQIGFLVGIRQDPEWLDGAAHLTEHLLCRRGKDLPGRQVDRIYRRYLGGSNGTDINVYTNNSHTGYGNLDLARRRDLRVVFAMFAALIRDGMYDLRRMRASDQAVISLHDFRIERPAVDNETALNNDDLPLFALKAAVPLLYRKNPARRWGDSDPEQLARVKLGRLKQWAQGWYVPANMRVILIGPSRDEAVRMVCKARLNEIPAWPSATWDYDHSDDAPVLEGVRPRVIEKRDITMHHVRLLWPTKPYGSSDSLVLEVLADILKDRIEQELREYNTEYPGGVYHPEVDWDHSSSHGFLDVWLATKGDWEHTQRLIERTLAVCEHLKNDLSSALDEDTEDCRGYLADSFLMAYRFDASALADRLVMALANGDTALERFQRYPRDIMRVTPRQVRAAAATYLTADRYVQVIIKPVP